ncbi:MAG: ComEC family competence protein [Flavobacteriales bacterium]|nr:ComEC family competence protein [Flavobacteriales bacterium]
MLRVIPPFLIGVVSAAFCIELIEWDVQLLTIVFSVIATTVLLGIAIAGFHKKEWVFGLVVWIVMFGLGSALTLSVSNEIFPNDLSGNVNNQDGVYLARIEDEPQIRERSVKVIAELTEDSLNSFGKVLLYFSKDSISENLRYGQILAVNTNLQVVENLGNPNEFNYKRYLRFNGIGFRGYVRSDKWKHLSNGSPGFRGLLFSVRRFLINKLKQAGLEGDELSVASALILGFRADLDRELMTAYAGAGATHVLAVSGLHVGIVYVILNGLLKFMDRKKSTKIIKTFLLIGFLFGYAGLTGFSASVVRAATMFSFVAFGKMLQRDTNIYNTLAASAFCLIALEPMIIMQVGFQLSYAAVIGIVLIQPRLFKLYAFNNRLADWAWSITCVSIAAQIATFPLGLLYFHQFPNLFLVSNLLVIPAAAGILYLGFSLFIASIWKPALLFFGFLLDFLISTLNTVVVWIEQIPYSVLQGIDISTSETLMTYAIIAGVLVFIAQKQRMGLYLSLSLTIALVTLQIFEVYEQRHQKFITIYNVRGETAIALFNGTQVTFIGSKGFYNDEQTMLFHVRHHWWRKGVETEAFMELNDSLLNSKISFSDFHISIIDLKSESDKKVVFSNDKIDVAVLKSISWQRIKQLNGFQSDRLVMSSSLGTKSIESISHDTENLPSQIIADLPFTIDLK